MRVAVHPHHADLDVELGRPRITLRAASERPALKRERAGGEWVYTRNGIVIPYPGVVRWLYLRFSDQTPDLEGEIAHADTFRRHADESVRRWGGWFDINHYSRPKRFPEALARVGRSPDEYVIGKITEIRVDPAGVSWAEGHLWPATEDVPPDARSKALEHADTAWSWLRLSPQMVHCSAGGPMLRGLPSRVDGRDVVPVQIFLNHIAIALQGVNSGTEVSTRALGPFAGDADMAPIGEVLKAWHDGIDPLAPSAFGAAVLANREAAKAMTAGQMASLVPEDLEGSGQRGVDRRPATCKHYRPDGRFHDDRAAEAHLCGCCGWSRAEAALAVRAARSKENRQ